MNAHNPGAGPGSGNDRGYKRSWKNLLINKRYQLRFTLFMVGVSSLLMVGLGIWVMRVANETTEFSMTSVRGEACPKVPELAAQAEDSDDDIPTAPMKLDDAAVKPGEPRPAAGGSDRGSA
ncbi:MAG TPA: hypothetical protein VFP84_17255, partial [Kofleriaceae bacterium]|nr:hypothetical protein [Kofleriaceae bacterium]